LIIDLESISKKILKYASWRGNPHRVELNKRHHPRDKEMGHGIGKAAMTHFGPPSSG
jgi:hypothetical protein